MQTEHAPTKTPAEVLDLVEYGFYRRHRNEGISAERMAMHFPTMAHWEERYQQEVRA